MQCCRTLREPRIKMFIKACILTPQALLFPLFFAFSKEEPKNIYGGLVAAGAAAGLTAAAAMGLQDVDMEGSGSLHMEDGFISQAAPTDTGYVPEQSMNLSKLLYDDDEPPSLTESEGYDDVSSSSPSAFAPAAAAGGLNAMMAVYNRLQGGNDDFDDDMPGIQEVIQMKHFSGAPENASRWTTMQQQAFNQSIAQESTRTFFMQSQA